MARKILTSARRAERVSHRRIVLLAAVLADLTPHQKLDLLLQLRQRVAAKRVGSTIGGKHG